MSKQVSVSVCVYNIELLFLQIHAKLCNPSSLYCLQGKKTPLDHAIAKGHDRIAKLLRDKTDEVSMHAYYVATDKLLTDSL